MLRRWSGSASNRWIQVSRGPERRALRPGRQRYRKSPIRTTAQRLGPLSLRRAERETRKGPYKTTFSLNPEDFKYIDIVGSRDGLSGIMVHHIVPGVDQVVPNGDYMFTVVATGQDIPSASAALHVWNTDGTLHCDLL